jgi:hypothetical protein
MWWPDLVIRHTWILSCCVDKLRSKTQINWKIYFKAITMIGPKNNFRLTPFYHYDSPNTFSLSLLEKRS